MEGMGSWNLMALLGDIYGIMPILGRICEESHPWIASTIRGHLDSYHKTLIEMCERAYLRLRMALTSHLSHPTAMPL